MVNILKRRWQLAKVRSGDGSALRDYRFWQVFSRSLFFLDLASPEGNRSYAVDVRHLTDAKTRKQHDNAEGRPPAALYRDGVQVARSNLPTAFPVPGGVIEVAISAFGLKRMHFVPDLGGERVLRPHPRSQEGLRARFGDRFPRTSAVIGTVALVILLAALVVNVLHVAEVVTHSPAIAERVGTFVSPIHLPTWANVTLIVAALLSGVDRALRLQHNRFIDVVSS
ncbi:hypothetical protein [Saccharopolyspora dendranthemae]|uniref:Uncharacterized protein n=1 Tax=Saccharopolyspora dendranthemae TaxID=1181886 RepID=A0A561V9R3_9PSEU|nr:hypothetical protein [Saccharopolyspora dendranthemae]TWG08352.1 hypothetical protein FHU35_11971 [Saccharopolyspora dendranthemae]